MQLPSLSFLALERGKPKFLMSCFLKEVGGLVRELWVLRCPASVFVLVVLCSIFPLWLSIYQLTILVVTVVLMTGYSAIYAVVSQSAGCWQHPWNTCAGSLVAAILYGEMAVYVLDDPPTPNSGMAKLIFYSWRIGVEWLGWTSYLDISHFLDNCCAHRTFCYSNEVGFWFWG